MAKEQEVTSSQDDKLDQLEDLVNKLAEQKEEPQESEAQTTPEDTDDAQNEYVEQLKEHIAKQDARIDSLITQISKLVKGTSISIHEGQDIEVPKMDPDKENEPYVPLKDVDFSFK